MEGLENCIEEFEIDSGGNEILFFIDFYSSFK